MNVPNKLPSWESAPANNGIGLIAIEREYQLTECGFTPAHDDQHTKRELQWAALAYLDFPQSDTTVRFFWPWDVESWKPTGEPLRDLAKAGALIAAEMDRLLRIEARNAAARGDARPTGSARVDARPTGQESEVAK